MSTATDPVRFADSALGECRHVCAFFATREEEYHTILPFIREGLQKGERAFHVVDPAVRNDHIERLRRAGVDVDRVHRTRQLEIRVSAETHLRGGRFNVVGLLALVQHLLQTGLSLGFPRTRFVAHAESVLEDLMVGTDWLEYEARLNQVLARYRDPVICTYDTRQFGAAVAVDILRTHPMVCLGGVLRHNPFFGPPNAFLRELAGRRACPKEPLAG